MADSRKTPLQSVLAGGAAGGIESLVTYPTEYVKTHQQLRRASGGATSTPLRILLHTIRQDGFGRLYAGGAAFCISNATKSGVRFLTFDSIRKIMPKDSIGKISPVGNMLAGVFAGIMESVVVVTPGETLKTRIVDDRAGPKIFRSTTHAIRTIVAMEGLSAMYRGVVPVILKQSSNAMVRFTSYNLIRDQLASLSAETGWTAFPSTMASGAMAGIITVYATMPFDSIKTRLQAAGGMQRYRGTLDCIRTVVGSEGLPMLWRGTTPRLIRLSVSGAISFSVYERVLAWTS